MLENNNLKKTVVPPQLFSAGMAMSVSNLSMQ